MSTSSAERALVVASGAVALVALAARVHDVSAFPPMRDFDAGGHAVSVVDLLEGRLPDPRSWSGSHPPLYYAIGAVLWALLPASLPVHVILRLISVAAWMGTVGLVWRWLRRIGPEADAAVVGALLLGIPGLVIASCMMTNDPLCAFFVTAALVRMLEVPEDAVPSARHAAVTAALAGLAAATKATGIVAVGMAGLFYGWRARRRPWQAVRSMAVVAGVTLVVAGPHYVHLFRSLSGPAYAIVGARAGSQEKEAVGLVVYAVTRAYTTFPSLPALFHAAFWGDPTFVYLPRDPRMPFGALTLGGLLVLLVVAAGIVRACVRPAAARGSAVALVFGGFYAAALLPIAVQGPYMILTKTNYMLPGVLPASIVLALGLGAVRGGLGTALRAALLVVAAGGVASTWYGWWEPPRSPSAAVARDAPAGSPARTALDYFVDRARDPIRTLALLGPEQQLAHELRMVRVLGIPMTPEGGLAAGDARSLELARARVAWLELYNLIHWIEPMAAAFDVRVVGTRERGDGAEVHVRVEAAGATAPRGAEIGLWPFPGFDQHFTLERAGDWRIVGIRQDGVVAENAVQAFVADPTLAGLERLRALGWEPPWERPIAAVLREQQAERSGGAK